MCFVCARYCHICWQLHLILWSQSQKALEFSLVYHCGFSVLCFKTDFFLSPLKLKFNYYFICFPILWHPSWFVIQIFDLFLCVSPASCLLYTSHMVHWILPLHGCETMHAGSCGEPIPEPGFCLGVCVCVCAGLEGRGNLPRLYKGSQAEPQQHTSRSSSTLSHIIISSLIISSHAFTSQSAGSCALLSDGFFWSPTSGRLQCTGGKTNGYISMFYFTIFISMIIVFI